VIFTYRSDKRSATALQESAKGRAIAQSLDIRDVKNAKALIDEVKTKYGTFDILVNNAGILLNKPLMLMEEKDWSDVIDTNLTGLYNMTRASIITLMKQKRGCIINISSVSGLIGLPGQTNYAASKAGIIGFTKALAKEVGPYNIRVNAIAPGFIETDMLKTVKRPDEFLKWIPLARFGEPKEVAEAVLFLASDYARYITGQVIRVDGGLAI
jgi:3-oxoacyl-[acyl-carrier protein] reductase